MAIRAADGDKNSHILTTEQWYALSAVNKHAWYCMVLHGSALYCMVFYGIACYCIVLHGLAWYCIVLHLLHVIA